MTDSIALLLQISPSSGVPIFMQLIEQFERLMLSGQLTADTMLPPVRGLAQQLQINPMTVSRAYSALEQKGWVERQRGVGMRVKFQAANEGVSQQRLAEWEPKLLAVLEQGRQLGISRTDINRIIKNHLEEEDD